MDSQVDKNTPYFLLDCDDAFNGLTEKEKKYAYHMSLAAWAGCPIILHQVSHESPQIFALAQRLFRPIPPKYPNASSFATYLKENGCDADNFINYFGYFLGNIGNYTSFGAKKFVPATTRDEFRKCVHLLATLHEKSAEIIPAYDAIEEFIFSTEPKKVQHIGIDDEGVSAYYTSDMTSKDIALVQRCLEAHHIRSENTRVAKLGDNRYCVRVASAHVSPTPVSEFESEGAQISICDGGFSAYLTKVIQHLREARKWAANETQERMIDAYIKHFEYGDIEDHKESQRIWVKDRSPVVETNIGFVETYVDPAGVRAEWEGFVAIIDKKIGKAYNDLVEHSEELIVKLPWGPSFEKTNFIKPDFTAINVLTFATANIPMGINIPNFDDVREEYGFKNVVLINALAINFGTGKEDSVNSKVIDTAHVVERDAQHLLKYRAKSFAVNVGLHELLGHGSGKVLTEDASGNKNFDPESTVSPLTGKPVTSWYKAGQTYDSVLKELASPMEECRAESVGILLSTEPEVLRIFGYEPTTDGTVHDITYANWLGMTRDAISGFGAYNPETRKWGQAHINARYVIARQLMRFGVAKIELVGDDKIVYSVDRSKILTDGVAAIKDLLTHLQVYRATGDYEGAKKFFGEDLSSVDSFMSEVRRRVMLNKKPRRQIIQCVPVLAESGDISLRGYECSSLGMIDSYQDRFPEDVINPDEKI